MSTRRTTTVVHLSPALGVRTMPGMSSLPPPVPPVPAASGPAPTGKTLISSAWAALRQDRELVALPVIGAVATLLSVAPLLLVSLVPEDGSPVQYVIWVAALFVAAIVGMFFAVALAAGAHMRMNGGDPTIRSTLAVAWKRKRGVIGWAALTTTVGLILRAIEQRFKGAGSLIRFAGDVAWTLASFFVVPIIAANDAGPIEALKLSASTFKQRWNSAVRVQLRLGLLGFAVFAGALVAGVAVVAAAQVSLALAILVGVILGGAWLVAMLVLNALSSYARVALYRYCAGLPTPGFATGQLSAAFVAKR